MNMTLDKQVEVELLKDQKKDFEKSAVIKVIGGVVFMSIGIGNIASLFTRSLDTINRTIAYSAANSIKPENVEGYLRLNLVAEVANLGFLAGGGLFLGLGIYSVISGAIAENRAKELADEITKRMIEESPEYKASQAQQ